MNLKHFIKPVEIVLGIASCLIGFLLLLFAYSAVNDGFLEWLNSALMVFVVNIGRWILFSMLFCCASFCLVVGAGIVWQAFKKKESGEVEEPEGGSHE